MQVLQNSPDAPSDLRQKSLRLAGRVIEFDPDVRGGQGYTLVFETFLKRLGIVFEQHDVLNLSQDAFFIEAPANQIIAIILKRAAVALSHHSQPQVLCDGLIKKDANDLAA